MGISVGDGWINARMQMKVYVDYAFTLGYSDTKEYNDNLSNYKQFCEAFDIEDWTKAYKVQMIW